MIKSLELFNFQAHQHTYVEFDEGVNAIIGLSDSGKSSILRALFWIVFNRPDGDEFISHWGGDCEVVLEVENAKITRRRTKSDNAYFLDIVGQDRQEFRAFGRFQVPAEIQTILNMDDINIQAQMDSSFLLAYPPYGPYNPGEVAQILNKVVNLDIIDSALSNIRKKKKEADDDFKASQKSIKALNAQLDGFKYLDDMETGILVLESLGVKRDQLKTRSQNLNSLMSQFFVLQTRQQKALKILEAERDLNEVLALVERRTNLNARYDVLASILDQIDKKTKSLASASNLVGAKPGLDSVLLLVSQRDELEAKRRALSSLISDFKAKHKTKILLDRILVDLEDDFKAQMPSVCPLCGKGY